MKACKSGLEDRIFLELSEGSNNGSINFSISKFHPLQQIQNSETFALSAHYTFCIKKCGESECSICLPLRMDSSVFHSLKNLPDPVLGSDGHYLPFDEVFKQSTMEKDRPSLKKQKHKKSLSYSPVKQHVTNVNVVIQCDECDKW